MMPHSSGCTSYRKVQAYGSSCGCGETILIVEDDELVRPSVESLIESLRYRVLSARD